MTQFMAFSRSQQKRSGVLVKHLLCCAAVFEASVAPPTARLQVATDATQKLALARNIALFTVAFEYSPKRD